MEQHTPGPWKRDGWHIRGVDNSIVAEVIPWDASGCRQEDHANVKLITAAPDLLAACQAALEEVQHFSHGTVKQLADAILKAKGE